VTRGPAVSPFTRTHGEYEISDDPARLDLDVVERLLHATYWAWERPREVIEKTFARSLCVGAYLRGTQVGFARAVTDGLTFAWICDVVLDDAHRGTGQGRALVEAIVNHPEIVNVRQVLATRDAHGLYEKFGYERYGNVFLARNFKLRPES
jgi:GNAT superfamily N-acetyltransferase